MGGISRMTNQWIQGACSWKKIYIHYQKPHIKSFHATTNVNGCDKYENDPFNIVGCTDWQMAQGTTISFSPNGLRVKHCKVNWIYLFIFQWQHLHCKYREQPNLKHCGDGTWALRHLKPPTTRCFIQLLVQASSKENITGGFFTQKASNVENVSM